MTNTMFHPGESAAQSLAGVATPHAAIRDWMPGQHRAFFGFASVRPDRHGGSRGRTGRHNPHRSAGLRQQPRPEGLCASARFRIQPIRRAGFWSRERRPGILGIDLATRRRNRANGVMQGTGSGEITISVRQSFGNCPQYIQTRFWQGGPRPPPARWNTWTHWIRPPRTLIGTADTFFVASSSGCRGGGDGWRRHQPPRAGRAGFVRVDENALIIPDFHGNRYFNTFGNLPAGSPARPCFSSIGPPAHCCICPGRVEILWNTPGGFEGAERLWRLSVTGGWRRPAALALRWSFGDFAPQTLRTGRWGQAPGPRASAASGQPPL